MIYVYGDDGADGKKERVTAVSVVAGYEDWWKELEESGLLDVEGLLFTRTNARAIEGDYKNIPRKDNKEMFRNLTTLLAESKVGGVAIAIDLVAQRDFLLNRWNWLITALFECLTRIAQLGENLGEVAS